MGYDFPYMSYISLYIISMHILHSNSKTSTHWRLEGRLVVSPEGQAEDEDAVFNILRLATAGGQWLRTATHLTREKKDASDRGNTSSGRPSYTPATRVEGKADSDVLDCGKVVNFTYYDYLVGVANRFSHPHIAEPEVSILFKRNKKDVDLDHLERKLRKVRKEKPKSVQVYNQIGNYWRIRGNPSIAIECFRKALALSPNNAEALLSLARLLLKLQYVDDALYLTRRSLDTSHPNTDPLSPMHPNPWAWMQHYTLGEILKAYGQYPEASLHLRRALQLNPDFLPALQQLQEIEMENLPGPTSTAVHVYTLFIIVFLILGVLFGILSSLDANMDEYTDLLKTSSSQQRHFNRAMAMRTMRSFKMGVNPRSLRFKKNHC